MAYRKSYGKRGGGAASSNYSRSSPATSTGAQDVVIELDKKKQVTVRQFNGINLVDIREYYIDKDTREKKPGKKGISLTEDSWLKLAESQYKIQDALDRFNGLGGRTALEPPAKKLKTEESKKKVVGSEKTVEEDEEEDVDDDEFEDVTEAKPAAGNENEKDEEHEVESEEE